MAETNNDILQIFAGKKLGYELPPYISALSDLSRNQKEETAIRQMSPEELQTFVKTNARITNQIFPFSIKKESEATWWELPIEPVISIKGSNNIVTRNIAKSKGRGTVKEYWSQNDYEITVNGIFFSEDFNAYPEADVLRLKELFNAKEALEVKCDLLRIWDIFKIVVTDWDIPFTKGTSVQAWSFNALSDDPVELFVDDSNIWYTT
jgi:hypothetical protein